MTIYEAQSIYMVGIKGFGMASLATLLVKMGKQVTGSDVETRFPTDDLLDAIGVERKVGFHVENLPVEIDMLITTGAHGGLHNPEVDKARERGVPVYTHAEALGMVMELYTTSVAVCGCHGKTTTSAMCAYVMHHMGLKLGYQVGSASFSGLLGGDHTGADYFVVEADEYVASPGIDNTARFLYLSPTHALCLNIDLDHVDVYPSLDAIKAVYREFFMKIRDRGGMVVYCGDDDNAREVVEGIEGLRSRSYGVAEHNNVRVIGNTVRFEDGREITLKVGVPGRHNVLNACGVLTMIDELDLDVQESARLMEGFTGSKLRFEILYSDNDYVVINDYAHHPVEIKATIQATREAYPDRRIISVFHPHTVSRTKQFENECVDELAQTDISILLDIFTSARESADESFTSQDIVERAHARGVRNIEYVEFDSLVEYLQSILQPKDVILWMGAGDKQRKYEELVTLLSSHENIS